MLHTFFENTARGSVIMAEILNGDVSVTVPHYKRHEIVEVTTSRRRSSNLYGGQ